MRPQCSLLRVGARRNLFGHPRAMPIFRMNAKANGDLFPCAPLRHYDMALRLIDDLSFVLRVCFQQDTGRELTPDSGKTTSRNRME